MLMTLDWASYFKFRASLTKAHRAIIAYLEVTLEGRSNDGRLRTRDQLMNFELFASTCQLQVRKLAGRHQMNKINSAFHDVSRG